jgi:hypothetical protein
MTAWGKRCTMAALKFGMFHVEIVICQDGMLLHGGPVHA